MNLLEKVKALAEEAEGQDNATAVVLFALVGSMCNETTPVLAAVVMECVEKTLLPLAIDLEKAERN